MTSSEEKIVVLEEPTPYDLSLKWSLQQRYYQERGKAAWVGGEVPYYITCNGAAARQRARFVHSAVEAMERDGSLGTDDPIYVLELAGGIGMFAMNCLDALRDLDRERSVSYAPRIRYILTDYSEQTLADAAKTPAVQAARAEGRLELYRVDALKPAELHPVAGSPPPPRVLFTAIIANYLYCHLPLSILRKWNGELEEQRIRLTFAVPAYLTIDASMLIASIADPGLEALSQLVEERSWAPPRPGFFEDPAHEELVASMTERFEVATIPYPRGSLASLRDTLPMLREGGVLLVTDKGFRSAEKLEGVHECTPSHHGNAFAHTLNFPILQRYAQALGYATGMTDTADFAVQTLLVEKRATPALAQAFAEQFVDANINVDAMDFYSTGAKLFDDRRYGSALRFLLRALALGWQDATILYYIGSCYFGRGAYDIAYDHLTRGAALDRFAEVDFEVKLGGCCYFQKRYAEASHHYERSLERDARSHVVWYNLGRCKERLGDREAAAACYRRSTDANPFDKDAEVALKELELG